MGGIIRVGLICPILLMSQKGHVNLSKVVGLSTYPKFRLCIWGLPYLLATPKEGTSSGF